LTEILGSATGRFYKEGTAMVTDQHGRAQLDDTYQKAAPSLLT
jgi:hypothetical protein